MSGVVKTLGLTVGIAVAAVLLLFVALMIDWGRSKTKVEKEALVAQAPSPDKQSVAAIHLSTTAMHGGPDKIYVTISEAGSSAAYRIYERTYECDDLSAFHLHWDSPQNLRITYGKCDPGGEEDKGTFKEFNDKQQNRVWRRETAWHDVKISYEDSKYVATH